MRLLHAETLCFHEFYGADIPAYAILSHRWEDEEVTYQDFTRVTSSSAWQRMTASGRKARDVADRKGFDKILRCCQQARSDGLDYVWVDTCCIDKSSSAELSESINSMFKWYQESEVCYAYLSDVHTDSRDYLFSGPFWFLKSQWWTRGWTLQELIAPRILKFFVHGSDGWLEIGTKTSLLGLVASRTGIDEGILCGRNLNECAIATRMSWASDRQTTRIEDMAYCLLGIFNVNMPLLYGEGDKAFIRLQEEIMKHSDDQTLFTWQAGPASITADMWGPLATSPSQFRECRGLLPVITSMSETPYSVTNKGLRIELPVIHTDTQHALAILGCHPSGLYHSRIALPIVRITEDHSNYYARDRRHIGPLPSVSLDAATQAITKTILIREPTRRMVEQHADIVVHIQSEHWKPIYSDPIASPSESDTDNTRFLRSDRHNGSILLAGPYRSHIMVLFSTKMQHIGRFACKVLYCPDLGTEAFNVPDEIYVSAHQALVYEVLSRLRTVKSGLKIPYQPSGLDLDGTDTFECPLDYKYLLDKLYDDLNSSNSRRSFAFLPDQSAVYATINLEVYRGEHVFRLDIQLENQNDNNITPFELIGSPAGIDQAATAHDSEDDFPDGVPTEQQEPHAGDFPPSSA